MAMEINSETQQFHLHTSNSSYVMELYEGRLAHVYWDSRLDQIPRRSARQTLRLHG